MTELLGVAGRDGGRGHATGPSAAPLYPAAPLKIPPKEGKRRRPRLEPGPALIPPWLLATVGGCC